MNDIIQQGNLIDGIYYLPEIQLDRKEYTKIAKHIEFLGGKWNRGKKGFIFDREIENIDELLGDNNKTKKDIQLFETPEELCEELCDYAEIDNYQTILEPSAGQGRIIKEIQKRCSCPIDYCEINEINRQYLNENNLYYLTDDFLKLDTDKKYTRIIANPPFAKNQDIEHIMKMYELLSEKGILVSIASLHWQNSTNKKEMEFKKFLELTNAEIIELEQGKFKESGTMVKSCIIKIFN